MLLFKVNCFGGKLIAMYKELHGTVQTNQILNEVMLPFIRTQGGNFNYVHDVNPFKKAENDNMTTKITKRNGVFKK